METILDVRMLAAHPAMPPNKVRGVTCSLSWQDSGHWLVDFIVDAPLSALRLPAAVPPVRADGLWQRTCFELFLGDPASGGYCEFNFSPSGEWAAYRFDARRANMRALEVAPPRIVSTDPAQFRSGMAAHLAGLGLDAAAIEGLLAVPGPAPAENPAQYALSAALDDDRLAAGGPWQLGLSAVIEEADGTKSYWALAHPAGEPDFHHPDCFALELSSASEHAIRYRPPPG